MPTPGLACAYNARHLRSSSPADSVHHPANPEDAPSREGDAGQHKARNVQHRFKPDFISRDADVASGRGPAACATATPATFVCYWSALRLLPVAPARTVPIAEDRKSTRLNSSHVAISYAVFCLKKKKSK